MFSTVPLLVRSRAAQAEVSLLMPLSHAEEGSSSPEVDIDINGVQRRVSRRLIQMAVDFNQDLVGRFGLGHDCKIFTIACALGDRLLGQSFREVNSNQGSLGFDFDKIGDLREGDNVPATEMGDALCIITLDEDGSPIMSSHHAMVRASVDDGEPLYVSKLNSANPAVVHDFATIHQVFPGQLVVGLRFKPEVAVAV